MLSSASRLPAAANFSFKRVLCKFAFCKEKWVANTVRWQQLQLLLIVNVAKAENWKKEELGSSFESFESPIQT